MVNAQALSESQERGGGKAAVLKIGLQRIVLGIVERDAGEAAAQKVGNAGIVGLRKLGGSCLLDGVGD